MMFLSHSSALSDLTDIVHFKNYAIRSMKSVAASLLIFTLVFSAASTGYAADCSPKNSYRSESEIKTWLASHPVDYENMQPHRYAGDLTDDGSHESALNLIENIRYIAGLPANLSLSSKLNRTAEAASLVSYENDCISHTPTTPKTLDKKTAALGVSGCGESNLAWASWENCPLEWTILNSWMDDRGASNISTLGHRRWILNPEMKKVGFGLVSGSNGTFSTMYIFDFSRKVSKDYQIAWPAQNMPITYFPEGTPWSLSLGKKLNASKVSVTLTRLSDGRVWSFSKKSADGDFYVNNDGYGQYGCIIFNPENIGACHAGEEFRVNVSGVGKKISYTVSFFDQNL